MPKPKKPKLKKFLIFTLVLSGLFSSSSTFAITADHLVISQVQITGGSGKTTNDFVEIYNPTSADVDLQGIRLVKRTKTGTTDTLLKSWTTSAVIKAGGYFLWANSDFTEIAITPDATTTASIANDNGVALRNGPNNTGAIVDAVAWGEAANEFVEGAAFPSNPEASQSLERQSESNNNTQDFFLVSSHPRNSQTSVAQTSPSYYYTPYNTPYATPTTPPPYSYPTPSSPSPPPSPAGGEGGKVETLRISEILPDPFGDDTKAEFIEIQNYGAEIIDLKNWVLSDARRSHVIPKSYIVPALGYFVLYLESTGISLNNSGDEIEFREPQGKVVSKVSYGKAPEGQSYALTEGAQIYQWTTSPTPGQENRFTAPAEPNKKEKEVSQKPAKSLELIPTTTPTSTVIIEEMVAAATTTATSTTQTKPFWTSIHFWLILAPLLVICYIIFRKLIINQTKGDKTK